MEFAIHQEIPLPVFALAATMGAVANKTNFCTMGAVSDWINMGDKGRLRAWLRYLLGGLMFGIGMTLASGCGNKTLIRIGGGNIKSLVVLIIASTMAYFMLWSDFYSIAFDSWMGPLAVNLTKFGAKSQTLDGILGGIAGMDNTATLHLAITALAVVALAGFVFASADFRGNFDNILGGVVIGFVVVAGWYLTGSALGVEWKEWAEMADTPPSRVEVQSFTFSPMGDSVRYLLDPTNFSLINFGIAALAGVIVGSFLYSVLTGKFRIEWFVNAGDFANHAVGAVLMGVGGVLSMGCTVGQAITGVSTLAVGSMLTFAAIVAGAAGTMKYQYWKMMREA